MTVQETTTRPCAKRRCRQAETGSVLLLTLVFTTALMAIAAGLMSLANTEGTLTSNFSASVQVLAGAESVAELVVADLAARDSWTDVVSGGERAAFADGTLLPLASWHERLDLGSLTRALQRHTNAQSPWGVDTPVWRLFAWGPIESLAPGGAPRDGLYLMAWVADDGADGDGNPSSDANGVVVVRAQALGQRGAGRTVQVILKRGAVDRSVSADLEGKASDSGGESGEMARILRSPDDESAPGGEATARVRVLSWREVR